MKRFLNYKTLIIASLLIIGLFLRLYKVESRTMFDADQEWLAFRAKDILSGDLALLGPVSSIGSFSIGPGFIYLWSIISFLTQGNPISGTYLSIILGIVTCLSIYVFAKHFIDERAAFVLLFLASISSTLIFWDQNPWAPSLFYLSQIILLTGAYLSNKNKWGIPILSLGLVVGFQSHLGILLSLLSIFIYFIFVRPKKPNIKTILLILGILFLGFLPNIIFDIFNNFINLKRFISIFKGDGMDYFVGFGKIINTLSYSISSLFYVKKINILDSVFSKTVLALILANGARLLMDKKKRNLSLLLLITVIVPALFFYIQQGKFSEYYLMMTVPSLIFLFGLFIVQILNRKLLLSFIIIFSLYFNLQSIVEFKQSWTLGNKVEVAKEIVKIAGKENYGISINSKLGNQFGFDYIFSYYGVIADKPPKKGETKIITIAIPDGFHGINGFKDFGGIGLLWEGF